MQDNGSSKATKFFGIFVPLARQFSLPGLVLALISFIAFLILWNQGILVSVCFIVMIISGILAFLFLLSFILGMIGDRYLKKK